uniref:Gonadotropin subunit beta-2 n=1 Tax=Poecilia reticulata TaxID=8081 RepID=A0A3P9Q4Q1_POERE
ITRTLLFALMVGAVYTCTLMNHTIWLEKKNCTQCVAVNTTICSGYCYTRDTNLKGSFGRAFLIQRSCVPISLVYRAAFIPGCPQDDSSQLYYPAARCCSCRRCDTDSVLFSVLSEEHRGSLEVSRGNTMILIV